MLRLQNISWTAPDGARVLNDLSLDVPEGKLVVLTGPNGGGKTTLAKIIAGIVTPDSGKVFFDGRDISGLDVTERAKLGISFAFQQPVRFKGVTVRQLINLASGSEMRYDSLCEILSRVGLCAREYVDREVNATLSGGEIKRIEIATVLARHTRLSVFDEPEAGIDLWSFKNLIEVFQNMRRDLKGTLVIISHQERILNIADEIAVVSGGGISRQGAADEVMRAMMSVSAPDKACAIQEAMF